MKTCSKCKVEKPKEEFFVSRTSRAKDGLHNNCKECSNRYGKEWRSKHVGKGSIRKTDLKFKYGITPQIYDEMLVAQKHCCAICGNERTDKRRLCIDHNHTTGKVRGLLCNRCNFGLGYFQDKQHLLEKAIEYLNRHS